MCSRRRIRSKVRGLTRNSAAAVLRSTIAACKESPATAGQTDGEQELHWSTEAGAESMRSFLRVPRKDGRDSGIGDKDPSGFFRVFFMGVHRVTPKVCNHDQL